MHSEPTAAGRDPLKPHADVEHLHRFFIGVARRVGVLWAVKGAAIGIALSAVWAARALFVAPRAGTVVERAIESLPVTVGTVAIGAMVGAAAGWWLSRTQQRRIALEIERRAVHSNNLLVTAAELMAPGPPGLSAAGPVRPASESVAELVVARASAHARTLHGDQLFSARPAAIWLGVSGLIALSLGVAGRSWVRGRIVMTAASAAAAVSGNVGIREVRATVVPPSYTKQITTTVVNPVSVDVLSGSSVTFRVASRADSVVVVTKNDRHVLRRQQDGDFAFTMPGSEDGFVAFEPLAQNEQRGSRRLIVVTVRDDLAPRVRIVEPTRDLIVPDADRTLDIRISADDDFAVGSLKLKYTKVSGSGERFTFDEGEVAVNITRTSATQWSARAALALAPLLKESGDVLVYRAVATDTRPGSVPVESDALIAELASPGGVAALGFSLDPDEDRYGLSQQMVILKTERLIANARTMTAEAVEDEAMQLASEQRRVRAEFVFMMGGEFAQEIDVANSMGDLDETHEAESESDLSAGRMANRGRTSLLSAVRAMSRASASLATNDLPTALKSEKNALTLLQDAFARSRFLMRALSQREQLDMTRRLTGRLDSISRTRAIVAEAEQDTKLAALRAVLSDLLASDRTTSRASSMFVALAERVLQIDATSPNARRIAAQLNAISMARDAQVRALVDSVATELTAVLRDGMRPAPLAPPPAELRHLTRELRTTRGGPP